MYNLYLISLCSLFSFINWCPTKSDHNTIEKGKVISTTHFNILFAPDMSNRVNPQLYKRPLNDADILSIITNDLYPTILRFKRAENQKDKLMIDFINKELINQYSVNTDKLLIDFGKFGNQNERIDYILERNGVKQTLKKDITDMTIEFTRINNLAIKHNVGADIWNYLNQNIDGNRVLSPERPLKFNNNIYENNYRNILILPTDGYIEPDTFNKGYDLSKNTIDSFRKAFLKSEENDMQEFLKKNKKFQLNPVKNEHLKHLEILVMELYDRSLSKGGSATIHPTDIEIIKLLWTTWLQQSNVERFELHSYASSKNEAEKIILNFIGISK